VLFIVCAYSLLLFYYQLFQKELEQPWLEWALEEWALEWALQLSPVIMDIIILQHQYMQGLIFVSGHLFYV
jgi:hypothetical protein